MPKQLLINGEPKETDAQTVRELLLQMGLGQQAVAVELNRQVVPRKRHEQTPLNQGDQLELVTLVGGG